jgi:formylglycine-generating enzyme required for sulfatase activity
LADDAPSKPDVFLSYAREDEARARELATALGQHGLSVFWDREIPPGQTWHSHIGEALAHARCVVVAWSRHSIASQWVLEEAGDGRDNKVLVPVLFEAVQPPFGFRAIQAASLVDWRPGRPSPAFDGLLRAVQWIVGGQAGSRTEPEAEVAAPLQPEPSEPAPKAKPAVGPATPSPASSEPRAATVGPPDGQAIAWSRRTVAAVIGGFVALAGVGGITWWLTQPGPSGPTTLPPQSGPPVAESKPSKPVVDVEIAGPAAPERTSAAATGTGAPREAMRDCPECPEMVLVPAGEFTMGSPPDEPDRSDYEGPQGKVTIAAPFWAGRYEVTFAEWDACVAARGCTTKPDDAGWGRGNRPVINVSWNDANEYVGWLIQKTGKTYRLLSEAEWEYAARAGITTAFWWGQDIGKGNANCDGCGSQWDNSKTAPVGSFKANYFGLYDTAGNVWEWVEDCWHDSYTGAPTDGSAWVKGDCSTRVRRGGSWDYGPRDLRSASRLWYVPVSRVGSSGFRVARAPD